MKQTFIITDSGDSAVGIFPIHAKVSIEDNLVGTEEAWRDLLSEQYDVPVEHVFSEEEYNILLKLEEDRCLPKED